MPEILHEIFLDCLPSDLSEPISRVAPFNLSTVCRSWRDLALERPSLWASLELSISHQDCLERIGGDNPCLDPIHTNCPQIRYAWERWLEMSVDSPLDIDMDVKMHRAPIPIAEILWMTFRQQHRWRNCSVDFLVNIINPIISKINFSFDFPPHIEDFYFRIINEFYPAIGNYHLNVPSATRLTRLMIPSARTIFSQPVGRMEGLTMLHVLEINFTALPAVLRNAPNLESIAVGLHGDMEICEGGRSRIVLDKLKSFAVRMTRDNLNPLSQLLELLLMAPSLRSLEFTCKPPEELPETNLWAALKVFLQRSNPPIEILALHSDWDTFTPNPRIDVNPSSDDTLVTILEGLPGLKNLQIFGAIASSRIFRALARDRSEEDGGILCPLLRDITYGWSGYDYLELRQDKHTIFKYSSGR